MTLPKAIRLIDRPSPGWDRRARFAMYELALTQYRYSTGAAMVAALGLPASYGTEWTKVRNLVEDLENAAP